MADIFSGFYLIIKIVIILTLIAGIVLGILFVTSYALERDVKKALSRLKDKIMGFIAIILNMMVTEGEDEYY